MAFNLDQLFSAFTLRNREVPNRLAAQAMEINSAASGGAVNKGIIKRYQDLAKGGWGIVFVEATSITKQHLARENGLVLDSRNLDGFKRLVDAFKSVNDKSLLIIQLTHSGRQSGAFSSKVKVHEDAEADVPVLSESELDQIFDTFCSAIQLAKEAGMDGVDVKACHGYLGSEFLRPVNKREDKYGGTIENRARFISNLIKIACQQAPDFVTGARVSLFEGIQGGCGTTAANEVVEDFAQMLEILAYFVEAGADYLNVSAGIPTRTPQLTRPLKNGDFYRFSQYRYAKIIKQAFSDTAIIGSTYTTGRQNCHAFARRNIAKGYTDFAGFGRQNLADPLFPIKTKNEPDTINFCTLCGQCSRLLKDGKHIYCQTHYARNPYL